MVRRKWQWGRHHFSFRTLYTSSFRTPYPCVCVYQQTKENPVKDQQPTSMCSLAGHAVSPPVLGEASLGSPRHDVCTGAWLGSSSPLPHRGGRPGWAPRRQPRPYNLKRGSINPRSGEEAGFLLCLVFAFFYFPSISWPGEVRQPEGISHTSPLTGSNTHIPSRRRNRLGTRKRGKSYLLLWSEAPKAMCTHTLSPT